MLLAFTAMELGGMRFAFPPYQPFNK